MSYTRTPARDAKHAAARAYMREYMRGYRERKRAGLPPGINPARLVPGTPEALAFSREASLRATRRQIAREHPDGGYCLTCGIAYPFDPCPACADELAGLHVAGTAWEALVMYHPQQ